MVIAAEQLSQYKFFHFQILDPFIGCQFERCKVYKDEIAFFTGQYHFAICKIKFKLAEIEIRLTQSSDELDIVEITHHNKIYPFYCHK